MATREAYENLVEATKSFNERTFEIADYLNQATNVAVNEIQDDTAEALRLKITQVMAKMKQVYDSGCILQKKLEETLSHFDEL